MEQIVMQLGAGVTGGIMAYAHCIGMCGAFALHLSLEQNRTRMLVGQLLWHTGRLCAYVMFGALAGYAGSSLQAKLQPSSSVQNMLSIACGALILFIGLRQLGLMRRRTSTVGEGAAETLFRWLPNASSPGGALLMGLATGCLPCPIVIAFLAVALQSRSAIQGVIIMASLGMGTMIPLLGVALVGRASGLHLPQRAVRAGGMILVILGSVTLLRGTATFHHLLGCPTPPDHSSTPKPCCDKNSHGGRHGN